MTRVILPLAIIAAILFAPIYKTPSSYDDVQGIETSNQVAGYALVKPAIDCWRTGNISVSGDCEPKAGTKGLALAGAVGISAIAAVLGVLGILPVIGRLTSVVTVIAGLVALCAMGYFGSTLLGAEGGLSRIDWGSYLAGGGGLLTVISGLSGMRGR